MKYSVIRASTCQFIKGLILKHKSRLFCSLVFLKFCFKLVLNKAQWVVRAAEEPKSFDCQLHYDAIGGGCGWSSTADDTVSSCGTPLHVICTNDDGGGYDGSGGIGFIVLQQSVA